MEDHNVRKITQTFKEFYDCVPKHIKNNLNRTYTFDSLMLVCNNSAQINFYVFLHALTEQKLDIKLQHILGHVNVMVVFRKIDSDINRAVATVNLKFDYFNRVVDVLLRDRTTSPHEIESKITQYRANSPLMPLVKANRSILSDPDLLENFRRP